VLSHSKTVKYQESSIVVARRKSQNSFWLVLGEDHLALRQYRRQQRFETASKQRVPIFHRGERQEMHEQLRLTTKQLGG